MATNLPTSNSQTGLIVSRGRVPRAPPGRSSARQPVRPFRALSDPGGLLLVGDVVVVVLADVVAVPARHADGQDEVIMLPLAGVERVVAAGADLHLGVGQLLRQRGGLGEARRDPEPAERKPWLAEGQWTGI